MSGNIIIAAGVFLLAIQFGRIVTASPNTVYDLDSLKTNAIREITTMHAKFLTDFKGMIEESELGYDWVAGNDSMINHVTETAADSIANVDQLAEGLVQQGKNEGKSEEYFNCVDGHRENATREIEGKSYDYLGLMKVLREKAIVNIEKCLSIMEKLLEVVEGLNKTYTVEINLCQDKTCISEVLEEARTIYARSNVFLHSVWTRSIKIILHFKAVSRERQIETKKTISELMKNGHENMKKC